jgi:predicted dehydrogenase
VATEVGTAALSDHGQLKGICDAVSIASPTRSHFAVARDCLENGLHVLVEKPMTVTTDEAQTLVEIAATNKLVLQVGHLERFNPALLAVVDQIIDPIFIESHRLAPFTARGADVNVVLDLMIHDIDIVLHLVPSEVTAIHANGAPVVSDAPDIANVRIEFDNGCVANVTASRVSDKRERRMRFFQKDTYIAVDFQENAARVCRVNRDAPDVDGMPSINCVDTELDKGDAIRSEIEAFLYAIRSDSRPLVSGEDGLRALRAAIAIGAKLGAS